MGPRETMTMTTASLAVLAVDAKELAEQLDAAQHAALMIRDHAEAAQRTAAPADDKTAIERAFGFLSTTMATVTQRYETLKDEMTRMAPASGHVAVISPEGGEFLVTCPYGCELGGSAHQLSQDGAERRARLHRIATEGMGAQR
jgi:hypothetical protein